jgi:hypothetical protein
MRLVLQSQCTRFDNSTGLIETAPKLAAIAIPKWRATADEDGHYSFAVAL